MKTKGRRQSVNIEDLRNNTFINKSYRKDGVAPFQPQYSGSDRVDNTPPRHSSKIMNGRRVHNTEPFSKGR